MSSDPPQVEESASRGERRLSLLVLALALVTGLVVVATTYRDYGATWDEGVQARYGQLALRYFESGGEDRACNEFLDLRYYGPLVEMIPALVERGEGRRTFEVRHLFLGLLSVLSLPALWLYARSMRGPLLAAFGLMAIATMPRFFGHWFNNSKDTSFALAVMWFMASLAALFSGPRLPWPRVVLCGIATGLGLCARPGGLPLFVLFAGAGALAWLLTREPGQGGETVWRAVRQLLVKGVAVFAIAWAVMVAPWPWAHERPLANPFEAIRLAAAFPTTVNVLFDGRMILSDRLPWNYLTHYLLIATPLGVLALGALGLAAGVRDQLRNWRTRRSRLMALTQVWFFVPLALYVLMRPNIHGGIRHFLFILPALALFAANGAVTLVELARRPRSRWLAFAALSVVLLLPLRDLVRLHPYQVTYYNELAGGVGGASEREWTDYYLSSYAEAITWVNEQAAGEPERTFEVLISAGQNVLLWAEQYAAANVQLDSLRGKPPRTVPGDFYIGTTRYAAHEHFPDSPVVHSIGRDGALFTVVKGHGPAAPE